MRTKSVIDLNRRTFDEANNVSHRQIRPDIRRTIAEEYLDGRVNLHVHIRFDTEEYCAICDRGIEVDGFGHPITHPTQAQFLSQASPGEQQVMMLVRVAKALEIPEVLPIIVIPRTVARLKQIYDVNYCVGHPLELVPLLTVIPGDVVEDWELIAGSGCVPLRQNELPNEMVKETTEVVKHFSNAQTEVVGHGRYFCEAIDLISRCVVDVFGDTIGLEVTEGQQIPAQSLTLFTGPGKFSFRTFKGGHNDTLQKDSKDTQRARDSRAHQRRISG